MHLPKIARRGKWFFLGKVLCQGGARIFENEWGA